MKLSPDQINLVKVLFQKMESKNDFLNLLNIVKKYHYGEQTFPFEEKQLNYYINKDSIHKPSLLSLLNEGDKRFKSSSVKPTYIQFSIKKKSGAERIIHSPIKGLKEFQKALNIILQCVFTPHVSATGFVLGKSIVDNAKVHTNQNYVYNIDLKDFFPSIEKSRVWGRLMIAPFNLSTSNERKKIANMIAVLCCTPMQVERLVDGIWNTDNIISVLPQGAPTSPIITNAICEKLDIRLSGVAKRFGLNYSRYADDITFSSNHNSYETKKGVFENIYSKESTFNKEIKRIIEDQRFFINEKKVRLQKKGYRQEVTGLVVNNKTNINRNYVKDVRKWIYLWETYGYDKAYIYFLQKYVAEKGHIKKEKPNMMMVLEGKLLYLKMVKGEKDPTYLTLKKRFDDLIEIKDEKIKRQDGKSNSINIVDLIFDIGLDEAMKKYKT